MEISTKTKIYFSFLYFWITITYYFSKVITSMLYIFIKFIPDSFIIYKIPYIPYISKKTDEIKIVNATIYISKEENVRNNINKNGDKVDKVEKVEKVYREEKKKIIKKNITNTAKLLINLYWDDSIEIENSDKNSTIGGIDLEKLFDIFPEIKNSTVYITYYHKIQDILVGYIPEDIQETFKTTIKHLLIEHISGNNKDNKNDKEINIYKDNDLTKNYKNVFNELTF